MTIPHTLLASCLLCLGCASQPSPSMPRTGAVEAAITGLDQDPAGLRARISELEQRLASERAARVAAETRERALAERVHELEGQTLSLALDRIRMEQELLRTKIATLREVEGDEPGNGVEPQPVRIGDPAPADPRSPRSDRALEGIRIPGADRR